MEYVLLANGDSEDVYMIGKIASFQIQNLLVAYKERFDKDNFIKNLLLDNLLLVDIYNRAKKLHIETEVKRVVYIIETNRDKDGNDLEKVRSLFEGKNRDFVTAVDEKNIIVVKEITEGDGSADIGKTAEVIDLQEMYLDSFLTIANLEGQDITHAIEKLDIISEKYNVIFVLSVSKNEADLPECAKAKLIISL